jgi:hypothetical protein
MNMDLIAHITEMDASKLFALLPRDYLEATEGA